MKWVQGATNPHVIEDENGLWIATCKTESIAEQIVNFNNNFLEEAMRPIPVNQLAMVGWGKKMHYDS